MCDCIQAANKFLAEHNTRIELPWFGPQRPFVQTMKLDDKKRGKPKMMFASRCPFCGERYPEPEKYLKSDGGVESGHATASGSGPLPEPKLHGDACSALEPPHQAAETVGRYQEPKRAAGVTSGPSDTSSLTSTHLSSPTESK